MSNMKVKDQQELAYETVENKFMLELSEATCREDVHDILYAELNRVIEQFKLENVTADDLLPEFYKVWGLTS